MPAGMRQSLPTAIVEAWHFAPANAGWLVPLRATSQPAASDPAALPAIIEDLVGTEAPAGLSTCRPIDTTRRRMFDAGMALN